MGFVYRILNTETNKEYIGSTLNYIKRKKTHFYNLKNNKHHCIHLQRSYNKYGRDKFIFEILYEGDDYKEIEYNMINENYDNLYNVSKQVSGGDLISYHPYKEEISKKKSETAKRQYKDGTRDPKTNSRPGSKNGRWKGGSVAKHETCKCGEWKQYSAKQCISCYDKNGENNPFYGKEHTEETKKILSEKMKKRSENGYLPPNTNKIEIDGIIYKSQAEAARKLGVCDGTIIHRLKSTNQKYKNYKRL